MRVVDPTSLSCDNQKRLPQLPMVPWEAKPPLFENHWSDVIGTQEDGFWAWGDVTAAGVPELCGPSLGHLWLWEGRCGDDGYPPRPLPE